MSTVNNEKLTKRNLLILAEAFRRLASVAHLKGASLVSIEDAVGQITATDVEGALAELAAKLTSGPVLQKRELQVQFGDAGFPAGDPNGTADVINLGAVLPANARVISHRTKVTTLFSGGGLTAVKLDVGGTDAQGVIKQQDIFTGALTGETSPQTGNAVQGDYAAQQLALKFTPDAGHKMSQATAGNVTVTVWFFVLP